MAHSADPTPKSAAKSCPINGILNIQLIPAGKSPLAMDSWLRLLRRLRAHWTFSSLSAFISCELFPISAVIFVISSQEKEIVPVRSGTDGKSPCVPPKKYCVTWSIRACFCSVV